MNVIELARKLYENPETGYQENLTRKILLLEIANTNPRIVNFAKTGFKATIGNGDLHIGLVFDLDALPTPGHPQARGENHAAHSCGHHAQMAIMTAAFCEVSQKISNNVTLSLIGCPAEEYVELEMRQRFIDEGEIAYYSGKQQGIVEGIFDDCDLLISCHGNALKNRVIELNNYSAGFLSKKIIITGKAAHAGAYPDQGRNALNAANHALSGVALLRERFKDDDHIRFHPVITKASSTINVVPEEVIIESYLRSSSLSGLQEVNPMINQCLVHSTKALGCNIEILDRPGYITSHHFFELNEYFEKSIDSNVKINYDNITFASNDVADLSVIYPMVHFGFSGFKGNFHGKDFGIEDEQMAYQIPKDMLVGALTKMIEDKVHLKQRLKDFKQIFTKEEYIHQWLEQNLEDDK